MSYARDQNLNAFLLCPVSCRTVAVQEFGDEGSYLHNVIRFPPYGPSPATSVVLKLVLVDSCFGLRRQAKYSVIAMHCLTFNAPNKTTTNSFHLFTNKEIERVFNTRWTIAVCVPQNAFAFRYVILSFAVQVI